MNIWAKYEPFATSKALLNPVCPTSWQRALKTNVNLVKSDKNWFMFVMLVSKNAVCMTEINPISTIDPMSKIMERVVLLFIALL